MNKLLASLLLMAAFAMTSDVLSFGCGKKSCARPAVRTTAVPDCYEEEIVQVPVAAECETVCWCPPGTKQSGTGSRKLR